MFGPAYKGIPLSVVTAMGMNELFDTQIRYCSNRKEIKDHGDVGILLGSNLKDGDRVVIVEDVTTSGKSIDETYPIIKAAADVEIVGLMVSLNRQEVGREGTMCALDEVSQRYGFPTHAIVDMQDVVAYLSEPLTERAEIGSKAVITPELKERIDRYYEQYGAR